MSVRNELQPNRFETGRAYLRRVVAASMAGTVVEWYEFFLYGTAATLVFSKVFFAQGRQRTRRHPRRLRDLRRRLRRPPAGRHRLRPTRGSVRAQEAAAVQPAAGGRRHLPDGLPADVRADRVLGPGAAGGVAVHPGLCRRRRVGRRRSAGRRAQPERQPRLLGELAAGRRARREHAGHGGAAGAHVDTVGCGVPQLGLARRLLVVGGRRSDRLLHPHQGHRRADLPRSTAASRALQGELASVSSRC